MDSSPTGSIILSPSSTLSVLEEQQGWYERNTSSQKCSLSPGAPEAAPRAGQPPPARQPAAPVLSGGRAEVRPCGAGAARPCAHFGGRVAGGGQGGSPDERPDVLQSSQLTRQV